MSCYEWERGTIVLPSGQAPRMRAALNRAADARIAALTAAIDAGWAYIRTLTPKVRREGIWIHMHPALEQLDPEAVQLLQTYDRGRDNIRCTWRKPTQKAIRDAVVGRRKNPHTGAVETIYRCGYDASITLRGNTVIWNVTENNHACEHARSHPLAGSLFAFLATVPWTSRSGGEIFGNNEYNRQSDSISGGGNYRVAEYRLASARRQRELSTAARTTRWW